MHQHRQKQGQLFVFSTVVFDGLGPDLVDEMLSVSGASASRTVERHATVKAVLH